MPEKPVCMSTLKFISPKFQASISTANSKSLLWMANRLLNLFPTCVPLTAFSISNDCNSILPAAHGKKTWNYSQLLSFQHPLCQGIILALPLNICRIHESISNLLLKPATTLLWATRSCLLLPGPSAFAIQHPEWSFSNKSKIVVLLCSNSYSLCFTQNESQSPYEGQQSHCWFVPSRVPFLFSSLVSLDFIWPTDSVWPR